jgi:hypothetical protein
MEAALSVPDLYTGKTTSPMSIRDNDVAHDADAGAGAGAGEI